MLSIREKGMRNLAAVLARASVATIIAVAILIGVELSGAVVISSLMGRVAKLESDLRKAQDRIVELAASQSRLNASIDAADRSIKSLRSDLDHPRVQPLASIIGGGAVK
jgi:septal ring factor EnvC (AmiA/AmiB activator)